MDAENCFLARCILFTESLPRKQQLMNQSGTTYINVVSYTVMWVFHYTPKETYLIKVHRTVTVSCMCHYGNGPMHGL